MAANFGRFPNAQSPTRINVGIVWKEVKDNREEMENVDEKEESENHEEGGNADIDNHEIFYERVIPVNLTTGGHHERFENQVHGRNTPAVAQWTVGRSDISIHTSLEEGVGEKEKD